MSMSDVSDMLFEMYKANVAKAPKNQQQQPQQQAVAAHHKFAGNGSGGGQTSPTSAETHEPSTIAAIATNGAELTASKNLKGDEMVTKEAASFHPRIEYSHNPTTAASMLQAAVAEAGMQVAKPTTLTAIPTSVLVLPPSTTITSAAVAGHQIEEIEQIDVKPLIHPTTGLVITAIPSTTSVIKTVPPAAAIAAAMLRDGYHNFQQQLHAQELFKHHSVRNSGGGAPEALATSSTNILENFLRQQQRHASSVAVAADHDTSAASDTNDGDDEDGDDSRYNGCFEDIMLVESKMTQLGSAAANFGSGPPPLYPTGGVGAALTSSPAADYFSDESQKFMIAAQVQAQALRNLEYSLGDYGASGLNADGSIPDGMLGADGEPVYECRHCGKKYRWKSTLRRHENVECGGKEPSHQCPYCPYKSKQRGNLGVHVRKHHSNLPQLASKRRSKYSIKMDGGGATISNAGSDDSSSKLIIDCPLNESQFHHNDDNNLNEPPAYSLMIKSHDSMLKDTNLNETT